MNIVKVLRNTAIAAAAAMPMCCVYQNYTIRNEILNDKKDSIFWADIKKNKYSKSIPTGPFSKDYILNYFAYNNKREIPVGHHVRDRGIAPFPEGFHLPWYWKKLKQNFDVEREKRRNIASKHINDCENRENKLNNFINSDGFKLFIQNEKQAKDEFLKTHKNHRWVYCDYLDFNQLAHENIIFGLNLDYLKLRLNGANNGYPYKAMEIEKVLKTVKRDHGKFGHTYVQDYVPVEKTVYPYMNIKTFYSYGQSGGHKIFCRDYYAEGNPEPNKLPENLRAKN